MSVPIGIAGLGVYLPEGVMTAAGIAGRAGLPEAVVRERFGLEQKHVAADDEHVSDMAAAAGRRALRAAAATLGTPVAADAVDGIIYFGSPHKDFAVWLAAPRVQHLLGASRAWAFEVAAVSAGAPFALRVAADMMAADESMRTVLLVAASRESMLLDYGNPRSRFMFAFGDGAAAVVLRRGLTRNRVLASAFRTDGRFADCVRVPAGGSRLPASHATVDGRMHALDVDDPAAMKAALDAVSLDNFVAVAADAVRRSGRRTSEIGFLATLHTKRSGYDALLRRLGLGEEQSVYLARCGHVSAVDPVLALAEGERSGQLRDGMLALVLSAGTGYTWGATAVAWGSAGGAA